MINQKEHSFFKRNGDNLYISLDVPLHQSLFGVSKVIKHLDNRLVNIKYNKFVKDNSKVIVRNEGMTNLKSNIKGDLIITFNIKDCKLNKLQPNELEVLERL